MKLKGLVWFFSIALILISLWELSYTWVIRNYEGKVKVQAERIVRTQFPEARGDEKESLVKDLGSNEAMILRNHGALVVGRTVGEAFNWMHRLELACKSQLAAMAANSPLREVPPEILEETWNNYQPGTRRPYGLMEWPALLRKLDRTDPSFRT